MKKKIMIAAAAAAGAALILTFVKRKIAGKEISKIPASQRSHHLTDVFAHAKNTAV